MGRLVLVDHHLAEHWVDHWVGLLAGHWLEGHLADHLVDQRWVGLLVGRCLVDHWEVHYEGRLVARLDARWEGLLAVRQEDHLVAHLDVRWEGLLGDRLEDPLVDHLVDHLGDQVGGLENLWEDNDLGVGSCWEQQYLVEGRLHWEGSLRGELACLVDSHLVGVHNCCEEVGLLDLLGLLVEEDLQRMDNFQMNMGIDLEAGALVTHSCIPGCLVDNCLVGILDTVLVVLLVLLDNLLGMDTYNLQVREGVFADLEEKVLHQEGVVYDCNHHLDQMVGHLKVRLGDPQDHHGVHHEVGHHVKVDLKAALVVELALEAVIDFEDSDLSLLWRLNTLDFYEGSTDTVRFHYVFQHFDNQISF